MGATDPATLAFLAFSALLAGLAKGFSGFGAALVFMPLASGVIGPTLAAPMFLLIDAVTAVPMVRMSWKLADRVELRTIGLGALAGLPLGIAALLTIDATLIRWFISILSLLLVGALVLGWRYSGRPRTGTVVGVGFAAGALQGVAQISGPPVMVFWMGAGHPPARIRANGLIFFAGLTAITVVAYGSVGIMSLDATVLAALALPLYGAGLWLGSSFFSRASERNFRSVSYGLIVLAALYSLPVLDPLLRG